MAPGCRGFAHHCQQPRSHGHIGTTRHGTARDTHPVPWRAGAREAHAGCAHVLCTQPLPGMARHGTAWHSTAWHSAGPQSPAARRGCACSKGNFGTAKAGSSHARHRPPARLGAVLPCLSRARGVSPPAACHPAGHRSTDLCRCRGCSSSFWKQTKQKESIAWLQRPPCRGEWDHRPGSAGGVLASSSPSPVPPVASRSPARGHGVGDPFTQPG